MHVVKIGINPHWYSQFWIKQFYQLWRQGTVRLRPLVSKKNPYASFYFEVDGRPCLIDVHDKKETFFDPADYFLYFKAQFSSSIDYAENVKSCWNGTTLKRGNVPGHGEKDFDIVLISSISGGRHHKIALYEAISSLPLKSKLVLKMVSAGDVKQWGKYLERLGIEVITKTWPYAKWLEWNKQGRWCVLTRGKHDCLSFKMLDYCSIGTAVLADYVPTSVWPVPIRQGENFVSLELPSFAGDEMTDANFNEMRIRYKEKAHKLLPVLRDDVQRQQVAQNNLAYFSEYVADGRAARYVMKEIDQRLNYEAV